MTFTNNRIFNGDSHASTALAFGRSGHRNHRLDAYARYLRLTLREANMELVLIIVVLVLLFGGGGYYGRGRGYW
jgi:hypothetical protein